MESNYEVCPYCHGRGMTRTTESGSTLILRAIEGEGVRNRGVKLTVTVPTDIAAFLLNQKRKQLSALEEVYDLQIIIAGDGSIKDVADFKISRDKIKTQSARDAAASCYDGDNVEINDDIDETEDFNGDYEDDRNKRFRFRRGNNRSRKYRRTDGQADYEAKNSAAAPQADKSEKKSWWQKLIG